ncbi:MAG: UbiA family prenyltransferase [Acidobacteria bacterium]|nr:UbiA family prenyltransferase [Acidobacteriota bacterium]
MAATWRGHLRIARLDHWVKNVFVLPGVAVALAIDPAQARLLNPLHLALGLLAVGLVASSNYVLNELLDAPYDRLHPLKRDRPVPAGEVSLPWAWAQWILLGLAGLALSLAVSRAFLFSMAALWAMGCVYNIPPVRAKDIPFVDVLAEAVNNPIRFLAGWYMTGTAAIPIASVLVCYWMVGCYFMAIKRYAESRDLRSSDSRVAYRKCFRYYGERNLLVSIVFYGVTGMLFFGTFMGRYRLEMALSFPFVAAVMAVYFALAFKPDSAAQRPEGLLREPLLMAAVVLCAVVLFLLLFVDVPLLHRLFPPTGVAPRG